MAGRFLFVLLLLMLAARFGEGSEVSGYCREQEYRSCEVLCDDQRCELRIAVILSQNTTTMASLSTVMPVLDLALEDLRSLEIIPSNLDVVWYPHDDKCDASYALISAIDSYADKCIHVYLGPVCEYALASIARIVKFLGNAGTPLLTVGGLSFDFVAPKRSCANEYHMLTRTGLVGFRDIAYFIIDLMTQYHWRKILIVNEPEGQYSVAGKTTCHLMMKTMAQFLKANNLMYSSWDTTQNIQHNFTYNLRLEMAMTYTSKFKWFKFLLIYERNARYEVAGLNTCFLQANTMIQMVKDDPEHQRSFNFFEFLNDGRKATDKLRETVRFDYTNTAPIFLMLNWLQLSRSQASSTSTLIALEVF